MGSDREPSMYGSLYNQVFSLTKKQTFKFYYREKKVADEREFELENTPDELERKKKIKEWKEEAGEC